MGVNYAKSRTTEVDSVPISRIVKVAAAVPVLFAAAAGFSALPALRGSSPMPPSAACAAWNGAQPSEPQASLTGVAMLSSCQVLAVGDVLGPNNFTALAMRFGGTSWRQQASSAPGASSSLHALAVTSGTNGWAAGTYANANGTHALIEYWNGTVWARQAVPEPGRGKWSTALFGVAASSESSAWAVGNYRTRAGHLRTLIVAWNGTAWRQVASPNPGGAGRDDRLTSVTVISARDAWAVGYYQDARSHRRVLVLHWDGSSWRQERTPSFSRSADAMLFGVTAMSASDAWAVGYLIHPGSRTLVLHWDGRNWARQVTPDPDPSGDVLSGVAGASPSNVWAVGQSKESSGHESGLILHWNGVIWTQLPSPGPDSGDSARLIAVTTSGPDDAWAVGAYRTPNGYAQGLFLHWNGRTWQARQER